MHATSFHSTIFVNLPVADVQRSRKFFADLGYTFNEAFSSDRALTVVLGEHQFAMLIQHDSFDALHPIATADAFAVKECVVCLTVDSRAEVDVLVDRALTAGGTAGDTEDSTSCTAAATTTQMATPGRSSGWPRQAARAVTRSGENQLLRACSARCAFRRRSSLSTPW